MRPDERLPRKRTASSGSRVPPAVTSTRRPASLPLGSPPASDAPRCAPRSPSGSAIRPGPTRPSASSPSSGPTTIAPRSTSTREVRLRRRVLPHRRVHRGRQHERAAVGERGLGQEVVGEPVGEPRHRVRGQRRDDEQRRRRSGADTGRRAAPSARAPRTSRAATNSSAPARDDRRDVVPGADEQPDELTGLVGGDAARHADEDSRHGHSVPAAKRSDPVGCPPTQAGGRRTRR